MPRCKEGSSLRVQGLGSRVGVCLAEVVDYVLI